MAEQPVPSVLWRQVYQRLRRALEDGSIPAGMKLPSTRDYALERGVSRSTVVEAYDQLIAEGFLESLQGSGTYASSCARGTAPAQALAAPLSLGEPPGFGEMAIDGIDLRSGVPDLEAYPWERWERAEKLSRMRMGKRLLGYGPPEGLPELRQAIARYLKRSRGLEADPERILVTGGTTQAIGILGQLLGQRGYRTAWLEDPVTRDIPLILGDKGIDCRRVGVDSEGLRVSDIEGDLKDSFVFTTPSHQFPSGAVLGLERRRELLERTAESGGIVVEDDYDSEFRYDGPPLATLASLAPERVVYAGTFSKTLAPGLRLAYLHLPPALVGEGRHAKWRHDLHNPAMIQGGMATFIDEGWYEAHLRAMRKRYREKRDLVLTGLAPYSEALSCEGFHAGMHLVVRLRSGLADAAFVSACASCGVKIYPVAIHAAHPEIDLPTFIFGYGHLDPDSIACACQIIGAVSSGAPRSTSRSGT